MFSSEPWHSIETTPSHFVSAKILQHLADVLGIHAPTDRHLRTADARLLAARGRGQRCADVLDVRVNQVLAETLAVLAAGSCPAMKLLPVSMLNRRNSESKWSNSRCMKSPSFVYGPCGSMASITP